MLSGIISFLGFNCRNRQDDDTTVDAFDEYPIIKELADMGITTGYEILKHVYPDISFTPNMVPLRNGKYNCFKHYDMNFIKYVLAKKDIRPSIVSPVDNGVPIQVSTKPVLRSQFCWDSHCSEYTLAFADPDERAKQVWFTDKHMCLSVKSRKTTKDRVKVDLIPIKDISKVVRGLFSSKIFLEYGSFSKSNGCFSIQLKNNKAISLYLTDAASHKFAATLLEKNIPIEDKVMLVPETYSDTNREGKRIATIVKRSYTSKVRV